MFATYDNRFYSNAFFKLWFIQKVALGENKGTYGNLHVQKDMSW